MKVNNPYVEIPNTKRPNIFLMLAITVIFAILLAGVLKFVGQALVWLIKLIITHWIKILIGIAVILLIKKFLFRKKSGIQEIRVVK